MEVIDLSVFIDFLLIYWFYWFYCLIAFIAFIDLLIFIFLRDII